MRESYCYWTVATGTYGALMESCVRSARAAGVFKEFHVLTDRPLEGCECYDACNCDKDRGLFKLHYLKVGMSRLPFDYFIWIDSDTVFVRNPVDPLGALSRSPIHVPLEANLSEIPADAELKGIACGRLLELYREAGIANQVYLSQSAFWIVNREAISAVFEYAFQFLNGAQAKGILLDADAGLGYAMQILCADPEAHCVGARPDLWASDDTGEFAEHLPYGGAWLWRHPLSSTPIRVCPALIHTPVTRNIGNTAPHSAAHGIARAQTVYRQT